LGPAGTFNGSFAASPDGTQLVMAGNSGLALVGNDGGLLRALALPAGAQFCTPVRWWDTVRVLISCTGAQPNPQLWLLPVSGAAPTTLTATPVAPDLGDLDAWPLGSDTYVQSASGCGAVYLAKVNPDRSTSPVTVPGVAEGDSVVLLGATGNQLALQASLSCGGGKSLFWFQPASSAETVLLGPPLNGGAVLKAIPFPPRGGR